MHCRHEELQLIRQMENNDISQLVGKAKLRERVYLYIYVCTLAMVPHKIYIYTH